MLLRKVYAIEIKSGRKRSTRGVEKFLQGCPHGIPVFIAKDTGGELFELQLADDFFILLVNENRRISIFKSVEGQERIWTKRPLGGDS
jgi:hypothetical protein